MLSSNQSQLLCLALTIWDIESTISKSSMLAWKARRKLHVAIFESTCRPPTEVGAKDLQALKHILTALGMKNRGGSRQRRMRVWIVEPRTSVHFILWCTVARWIFQRSMNWCGLRLQNSTSDIQNPSGVAWSCHVKNKDESDPKSKQDVFATRKLGLDFQRVPSAEPLADLAGTTTTTTTTTTTNNTQQTRTNNARQQ